jgi:hypothetical protein
MSVPEVPLPQTSARISSFEPAGKSSAFTISESKNELTPSIAKEISTSRRGKPLKVAVLLAFTLGLAFVLTQNLGSTGDSSNQNSGIVETEEESADSNLVPEPTTTSTTTPEVDPTEAPTENISVQSRFIYTSTGIKLLWDLTGIAAIESVEVSAAVNSADSQILGLFAPSTSSVELTKEDNAGLTSFKVSVITKTGQKVIAPALNVRGKFSAN